MYRFGEARMCLIEVLFDPDGSRRDVIGGDIGEQELRSALDGILSS